MAGSTGSAREEAERLVATVLAMTSQAAREGQDPLAGTARRLSAGLGSVAARVSDMVDQLATGNLPNASRPAPAGSAATNTSDGCGGIAEPDPAAPADGIPEAAGATADGDPDAAASAGAGAGAAAAAGAGADVGVVAGGAAVGDRGDSWATAADAGGVSGDRGDSWAAATEAGNAGRKSGGRESGGRESGGRESGGRESRPWDSAWQELRERAGRGAAGLGRADLGGATIGGTKVGDFSRGFGTAWGVAGAVHSARAWATGSPECCVCPVCRAIAAMRNPTPETAAKLASGAGDLATGVASVMRAASSLAGAGQPRRPAPKTRPTTPSDRGQTRPTTPSDRGQTRPTTPPDPGQTWSAATRTADRTAGAAATAATAGAGGGGVAVDPVEAGRTDESPWAAATRASDRAERLAAAERAAGAAARKAAADEARRIEQANARRAAAEQAGVSAGEAGVTGDQPRDPWAAATATKDVWAAATVERDVPAVAAGTGVDHDVAGAGEGAPEGPDGSAGDRV